MKILFVALGYEKKTEASGVNRKIKSQIRALENKHEVYYTHVESGKFKVHGRDDWNCKIPNRFSFFHRMNMLSDFVDNNEFELCYVRYEAFSNFSFLKFLGKLKKRKIQIVLEIPTYPYDQEFKVNFSLSYMKILIDKICRGFLKRYVDYIVTFSEDKKIFGIPCINICNGVELGAVDIVNKKRNDNAVVFTSVSSCCFWHGIDRMINSISLYYKNGGPRNIIFNIVGEGPETQKLNEIISKNNTLETHIKFYGFKSGDELDEIYNCTDVAIGCLGNHRKGIYKIQALKNIEYTAKGLPIVFSEDDPKLSNTRFVYKVSHDEGLFNIEDILNWYDNMNISPSEIRCHANKFTWDIQMEMVIARIEHNT